MAAVAESGRPLAELASFTRFPQILINVRVERQGRRCLVAGVLAAVAEAEAELGDRPGTAAPVRHRVAGQGDGRGGTTADAQAIAERVAKVVAAV